MSTRTCKHPCCTGDICRRPPAPPKIRKPLKRTAIKKPLYSARPEREELEAWFAIKMATSARVCSNCGHGLNNLDDREWRGSIHHVLWKSTFKSLATHPDNFIVLGYYCCHQQIHTSWKNASQMKVWPRIVETFRNLYNEIPPSELHHLPDVILQELSKGQHNPFS